MAAVLITVQDGTVDYVTKGDVDVVLIDLDRYDSDRVFPDEVDLDLDKLRKLPTMPWTRQLSGKLRTIKKEVIERIRTNE